MTKGEIKKKANKVLTEHYKKKINLKFEGLSNEDFKDILESIKIYKECSRKNTLNEDMEIDTYLLKVEEDLTKLNKKVIKLQKHTGKNITIKEMVNVISRDLDRAWDELQRFKTSEQTIRDKERLEQVVIQIRQDARRMAKRTQQFLKTERHPFLKGTVIFIFFSIIGLALFLGVRTSKRNKFFQELSAQRIKTAEMSDIEMKQRFAELANNMTRAGITENTKMKDSTAKEIRRDIIKNTLI